MKNQKKKKKIIYKIIISILFLVSFIFIVGLMFLNVLTMKLFMLVVGLILFIDFLFWLFIIKSKKKKISSLLAFILIITLSIGSYYLFKTNTFFNSMTSHYKSYNYSVVVLKESNHKELEDLDGLSIGYIDNDSEETKKSLEYINNKILPEYIEYSDNKEIVEDFLNKEIESILIEESSFSMIKEENLEFNTNSKVIKNFKIRIKIEDFSKDVNVTKESFNIFISGIDTFGTVESVSRSDVNMVVSVNPKTKQMLMTSIPRDYYVALHGINGYKDKITHAGLYGIDMSVKTVEDLLDIEINYYVKVNFTSVIDIVNSLNGVEVYSDYSFTSIDGYNYKKGYNKVKGEEALSFARERKAFQTGDNQRIKNQQALLQAIFKKCISKDIIYKYNKLLNSLDGSFITNMPTDRVTSLIKMQLKDMKNWTITSNSLTGTNSSNYTYSYAKQKLYVMEPEEESIKEAHNLITSVADGEVLENSYENKAGNSHTVTKAPNNTTNNKNNSIIDKPENSITENKESEETNENTSDITEDQKPELSEPPITNDDTEKVENNETTDTPDNSEEITEDNPKEEQTENNEEDNKIEETTKEDENTN